MHSADDTNRDPAGGELADVVSRLRRAMRRAARAADPASNLSVAQLELLSCVAERPGIRPGQLAEQLRLAPSSVATLVNGLRSVDLITRVTGLVPPPERGLAGGLYYERIRAAITREATVAAVVRDIERARKSATTTTQRAEDQDADDQQR